MIGQPIVLILALYLTKSPLSECRKFIKASRNHYEPTWSSLDSRPIPDWYQHAKLGVFCHWGVYSVPAFGSEWFWWDWKGEKIAEYEDYVVRNYKKDISYADFATYFTAEWFDAEVFREIVEASGARYFVFTSKHHEGFTMWPSKTSFNWNSVDIGPHRDIVGELSESFQQSHVHFGLYFSQYEWFNPLYIGDKKEGTNSYVEQVSYPQMLELVHIYRPEIIWSDGDWEMNDSYWKSKEFLAWLYNESPVKKTVVVNDRWGYGDMGKHGGFLTFADRFDPDYLPERKWESCITLDKQSWGIRRNMRSEDVLTVEELISKFMKTIALNGNLIVNIGPTKSGIIPPIFEDRLRRFGHWIKRNERAIFPTQAWIHQNDTEYIWYTIDNSISAANVPTHHNVGSKLFAFFSIFPRSTMVELPSVICTLKTTAGVIINASHIEPIEVNGKPGKSLVLNFKEHQSLASLGQIVVQIENFSSKKKNK